MKALSLLVLALAVSVVYSYVPADEVLSLPGWNAPLPSKQYSGYLNITSTKHLHYWLVLAETNPSTAPTVLWLNGGPGCSSLDGFMYEHGPFGVNSSDYSQLYLRDYRWSQLANILYLEAPVGVGFSYSDNPSVDYKCTDDTTANDNLAAMQVFFQLYSEYSKNPFFITGESYAGIYVPTLAEAIMKSTTYTGAPLKGIAVGNGCTGDQIGICGHAEQGTCYKWTYLTQLGMISNDLKTKIAASCNWTAACSGAKNSLSATCTNLLAQASNQLSNVNTYDVYGDCVNSYLATNNEEAVVQKFKAPHKALLGGPDACIDSNAATAYLNRSDVQKAIHVRYPGFTWGVCTDAPGWSYTSTRANLPRDTYPALIQKYHVTIYNGDWDSCVPYTDNEAWTENMGYPVTKGWHAWYYTSESGAPNQVAGYATQYNVGSTTTGSFEFITVRGGRHEVPETAPGKASEMLRRVINNIPF